ncbi:MAG TPA: M24 family metallopeptidase, partial [Anaerolineales bacterium]|nr:M24 family metallopeptidase [Anaerolineales bacterium]
MTIHYKLPKEVRMMRAAGALVADAFELLRQHIRPGVTLYELDKIAEDFIRSKGAEMLYKGYR